MLAYIDGNEFGIEATQFIQPEPQLDTANSIIGRWAAFDRLRDKVLQEDPNTLARHWKLLLTVVHFGGLDARPTEDRLPARSAIDVQTAIEALKTVDPVVRTARPHLRARLNTCPNRKLSDIRQTRRSIAFTWAALPPAYTSPFYSQMGFELTLGYHVTVTRSDLRDELRRLFADHDNAKTDTLVVSLNAPLRSGTEFPTSFLIADLLFEG